MAKLCAVVGYTSDEKDGMTKITTMGGSQFFTKKDNIVSSHAMDTNPKGAHRLFLKGDAEVLVLMSVEEAFGSKQGPIHGATTFKYYDDGGTIPKSYDDGYGPPKDPWSDKGPWDDSPKR